MPPPKRPKIAMPPKALRFNTGFKGENIQFRANGKIAKRISSYDNACVFSEAPIASVDGKLSAKIKILSINDTYSGSLRFGITIDDPRKFNPNKNLSDFNDASVWVLSANTLYHKGSEIKSNDLEGIGNLKKDEEVEVVVDTDRSLRFYRNGRDLKLTVSDIPEASSVYLIAELYGQCESISIDGHQASTPARLTLSTMLPFTLPPAGLVFNRAGAPVFLSDDSYYCGRELGEDMIPGSDGQCGPSNGPQCPDCKGLTKSSPPRAG